MSIATEYAPRVGDVIEWSVEGFDYESRYRVTVYVATPDGRVFTGLREIAYRRKPDSYADKATLQFHSRGDREIGQWRSLEQWNHDRERHLVKDGGIEQRRS